MNLKFS